MPILDIRVMIEHPQFLINEDGSLICFPRYVWIVQMTEIRVVAKFVAPMPLTDVIVVVVYIDFVGRFRTRRCHQHVSRKGGSGSLFLNRNGLDV
jgi:hypothetical protein